jgi:hypothetical protein
MAAIELIHLAIAAGFRTSFGKAKVEDNLGRFDEG